MNNVFWTWMSFHGTLNIYGLLVKLVFQFPHSKTNLFLKMDFCSWFYNYKNLISNMKKLENVEQIFSSVMRWKRSPCDCIHCGLLLGGWGTVELTVPYCACLKTAASTWKYRICNYWTFNVSHNIWPESFSLILTCRFSKF